jgi:MFS transporter, DHA1 family, staphyloferrin A biosynthesis exporter
MAGQRPGPSVREGAEQRPRLATFASLGNQQFRWLYISNAAFFFAMMGQFVVRSWLAYDMTGSAFALGLVNFAVAIPMLILSPFGGVFADRLERRRLIMSGQAVVFTSEAILLGLLVTGVLEFWHLLAATFVMGGVFPFVMPARQAIVANIVGRHGLTNAMALQMGAMNAARVVAPASAGFVMSFAGIDAAFAVAVALYAFAFTCMIRVNPSRAAKRPAPTTVLFDMAYGFRYAMRDRPVRVLLILGMVPMLLAMPFQSMLPVFASEAVWDVGEIGLGILHAAAGAGGLVGALVIATFGNTKRKLRLMMTSLIFFAGGLALFAISPWFLLGVFFVLTADIFASMFQTTNASIIQMLIPDEVRGRVMSLMMMTFGLTPLGTLPIAAAAQTWGAPIAVATACMITLAIGLLFFAVSASLRRLDSIAEMALEGERDDVPLDVLPAEPAPAQPRAV